MKQPMRTSECYTALKDAVIYSIHYAPTYPEEDQTDLSQEFRDIRRHLSTLEGLLRSEFRLRQLRFASDEIAEALRAYETGEDGRQHLEEALTHIDRSKRTAPPPVEFLAGPEGIIKIDSE